MSPAKPRRLLTKGLQSVLVRRFCLGLVLTGFVVLESCWTATETTAQSIKVQSSTAVTSSDPKDGEARQACARGELLRANWTAVSLRDAIAQYEKAAALWTSISDFANASEAVLKAADVNFILSEYKQALTRYQNAEALAKKSDNWLAQATALSQIGRLQSYLGKNDVAQQKLTEALDIFSRHEANRTVAATNAYGKALGNMAEVSYSKGEFLSASKQLDNALNVFNGDRRGEARVRLFKSYVAGSFGETSKAGVEISRALELYREENEKSGEGLALTAMGLWHSANEDHSRAIELHKQALEIFHAIGDRHSEAIALNAIGQAYEKLHEDSNALSYYNNALTLFEKDGALEAASLATYGIASTQFRMGNLDRSLASYERCMQLSRSVGNVRIEAYARQGIATIYAVQRRPQLALNQYENLERFFKSINDLRGQTMALNAHGNFLLQLGEKQNALNVLSQALSLSEKMGDNGILIATLYNVARANEVLGLHQNALSLIKKSFDLIEQIRANVASPDFRASYFSAVRPHYELCIEILMQLHRQRPDQGFDAQALSVSEQSRARLLIDLLSESRTNVLAGAARDLVENERRLRGLLRAQAQYQLNLSLSGKPSSELTEVTDQIARLRSDYQVVQTQLREQNPRLFSFEKFVPMDLARIQKELQGSDTMVLEYALGDHQSYLWAVTSNSMDSYILPARSDIESVAQEFYKVITARQGSADQNGNDYSSTVAAADAKYLEKASNLSQMLLGPVADKIGNRRLVVVTDGALRYIPFAALPRPSNGPVAASPTLLLATNELVMLPSASTLIAIRGVQSHNSSTGKLVAIIADPVLSPSDDRVQREGQLSAIAQGAADHDSQRPERQSTDDLRLARLAHASEEADAISGIAPWGTTLVAKGFEASRETAMSPEVSRAQIVHFATHGFLDSEHPELSGIVLSMTDRNGAKTNGLMPLPDIYSLDLSADLIVLSACQTALGKESGGEGLVGLTHSFMSAGAKSVVASLWKVDDRATAALMAEFYVGILKKGMTPAAALRSAQLKIMQQKQWSAPYYWAGFVLQGEYTNPIAVDQKRWLRPDLVILFSVVLVAAAVLSFQARRRRTPRHSSPDGTLE